jgi:hypothetical protein
MYDYTKFTSFADVQEGFSRLKKKNKYRRDRSNNKRFINAKDLELNALGKFLEDFRKSDETYSDVKIFKFYKKLEEFELDPFQALAIPKPGNKDQYRPLLVPKPKDRLLFDSLYKKVKEAFKPHLKKRDLYGLGILKEKNEKNNEPKVSEIVSDLYENKISNGYSFALVLDYSSFFSTIDRDELFKQMEKDEINSDLIEIIKIIINNNIDNVAAVEEKTEVPLKDVGVPQGLAFSPLLACYYTTPIDDLYLNNSSAQGYRYIDDLAIFFKNKKEAQTSYQKIKEKSDRMNLKLHPLGPKEKSELIDLSEKPMIYLGAEVSSGGIKIAKSAYCSFYDTISKEIFNNSILDNYEDKEIKNVFYSYVRGWLNHYESFGDRDQILEILDGKIEKFIGKHKKRKAFYERNSWMKVNENYEKIME